MRIVYCANTLTCLGGIEHVTVNKANSLVQISGNDVWIVVIEHKDDFILPIDKRIHYINLDVNYYEGYWEKNRLQRLIELYKKRKIHKKKLKATLDFIKPDVVISTDGFEKNILASISSRYSAVFIREIHAVSFYKRFHANGMYEKITAWYGELIDYYYYIKKYDRIVVLTQEEKKNIWVKRNVIVIPNPVIIKDNKQSTYQEKTVVSVGRLEKTKNFSSLIRTWSYVKTKHPDWKLEIWGNGSEMKYLRQQLEILQLQDVVHLMGYTNDVISKLYSSSIFVLSSLSEAFGIVIVEAMSCGLPVVAYDCPYGPRSLISEGDDGFLVPVGNEQMLADRINFLIENKGVCRNMGIAAFEKSKQYDMEVIIQKWMTLFSDIMKD